MTTQTERKDWLRLDKETGQIDHVTKRYVKERTEACYFDWRLACKEASADRPLQNSFAYYYPEKTAKYSRLIRS